MRATSSALSRAAEADLVLLDIDGMGAELDRPPSPSSCGCARSASGRPGRRPCRRAARRGRSARTSARICREAPSRPRSAMVSRSFIQSPSPVADHRADALVGQHLDQQSVRHPAVDDVRGADAAVDRIGAGAQLRDHPGRDAVMLDPLAQLGRGQALDQARFRRRRPRAGRARRSGRRSSPRPSPPRSPSPPRRR